MAPTKSSDTERIPLSAVLDTEELPILSTGELPALPRQTREIRGLVPPTAAAPLAVPPPVHAPLKPCVPFKSVVTCQQQVPVPVRAIPATPVRAKLVPHP